MLSDLRFTVKWVTSAWERQQAHALRRQVFCQEQGLFEDDDLDQIDDHAQLIVALSNTGSLSDRVVGTVRIHQLGPGSWMGSRLAVRDDYRGQALIGTTLIRLAVSSAHGLGCSMFYANVQYQNEAMFQHMHWQTLKWSLIHGVRHAYMQADLSYYPPCYDPCSGLVITN